MPARKKLQEPFFSELRKVEEGWKSLPLKLKARRPHWLQSSAWVFFSAGRAIASLVAGEAPLVGWHQAPKPCASANWGGHRGCRRCQDYLQYQGLQVCKCEVVAKQLKPRGSEGRCWRGWPFPLWKMTAWSKVCRTWLQKLAVKRASQTVWAKASNAKQTGGRGMSFGLGQRQWSISRGLTAGPSQCWSAMTWRTKRAAGSESVIDLV